MEPEPFYVPQDFYDMLMSLPDGSDVSEFFTFEDPAWNGFTVTLTKAGGPVGAQPDAAEE